MRKSTSVILPVIFWVFALQLVSGMHKSSEDILKAQDRSSFCNVHMRLLSVKFICWMLEYHQLSILGYVIHTVELIPEKFSFLHIDHSSVVEKRISKVLLTFTICLWALQIYYKVLHTHTSSSWHRTLDGSRPVTCRMCGHTFQSEPTYKWTGKSYDLREMRRQSIVS